MIIRVSFRREVSCIDLKLHSKECIFCKLLRDGAHKQKKSYGAISCGCHNDRFYHLSNNFDPFLSRVSSDDTEWNYYCLFPLHEVKLVERISPSHQILMWWPFDCDGVVANWISNMSRQMQRLAPVTCQCSLLRHRHSWRPPAQVHQKVQATTLI